MRKLVFNAVESRALPENKRRQQGTQIHHLAAAVHPSVCALNAQLSFRSGAMTHRSAAMLNPVTEFRSRPVGMTLDKCTLLRPIIGGHCDSPLATVADRLTEPASRRAIRTPSPKVDELRKSGRFCQSIGSFGYWATR
ncbi:hypothetical protein PQR05_31510 [Paraburkholderia sediminicola]|uniref:hypothetical protein n=1 Tax=Paraburkholderia sediminicola TaxID=458836 RepID=UPI0038B7C1E2